MTKKVVVIGGGHGQATILSGIKYLDDIEITAIVTVADDGGSTGRLRRQFQIPAMGDIRNVIIALSKKDSLLKSLMDYRFDLSDSKEDVMGHNLGNLILTAMIQTSGSFTQSIDELCEILDVKGKIIPSTLDVITLFARMEDDTIVKGECNIPNIDNHIQEVYYEYEIEATNESVEAIKQADLIILGCGSLYTSILPNVIIPKINQALRLSSAKLVYLCNIVTQPGETDNYSLEDHIQALEDHHVSIDEVIVASDVIPQDIIKRYEEDNRLIVKIEKDNHNYQIVQAELLSFENKLIRHDPIKITDCIDQLLKEV